ncbi:hypothetical protein [Kitasatospora sp. NE20-6]
MPKVRFSTGSGIPRRIRANSRTVAGLAGSASAVGRCAAIGS